LLVKGFACRQSFYTRSPSGQQGFLLRRIFFYRGIRDIYLKGYATMPEVQLGLTHYFIFYNAERTHQSLNYKTPDDTYWTASGGGARIADHFKEHEKSQGDLEAGAAPCRCASIGYLTNARTSFTGMCQDIVDS
jgi:hypothetical protein